MKLLLCRTCCDVVKLDYESRSCKCGAVYGRYREDGAHADVSANAEVIGLNNHVLMHRLVTHSAEPLEAWVFTRGSDSACRVHWADALSLAASIESR